MKLVKWIALFKGRRWWVFVATLLLPVSAWATHCTVSSEVVSFGEYDIFYPGPLDGQGAIVLQCDSTAPYRISLSPGLNSTNYLYRQLASAESSQSLLYNLYLDASRSIIWGDGSGGSDVLNGSTGSTLRIPIYGRIPPGQRMSPGFYSDAVLISVDL